MHVILNKLPTTRKRTRGPHTGDQNIVHTNAIFDAVMHAKKKMKEEECFLILQNPLRVRHGAAAGPNAPPPAPPRPLGQKKNKIRMAAPETQRDLVSLFHAPREV
jgi:hypothetical protein